jgi:predicted house-cleaning noncanonical NTP pyrophosphatase (MazG superfamily)
MSLCYNADMPTFKFAKLVRDKIVDYQIASGAKPTYRQLSPDEHKRELVNKIIEEAREITEAAVADVADEIADVQQAVDDLKEKFGLSDADIAEAQTKKNDKNGAFKQGLFVESVELADDDTWADYYRQNADRYPEISGPKT